MILVTGANGAFGRLVAEQLLARRPAAELAVSVRDPAAADALARRGVRVRPGDFDRPETLAEAFEGAGTVLVNGTNYGAAPDVRARQQAAAIQAAQAAGADRIVVTTWPDPEHSRFAQVADFPATERRLAASGTPSTVLRLGFGMAASLARDMRSALASGVLAAPAGDARVTPAAAADLAEATANVLVEAGHAGRTYELSGPDAIGWDDLAALATTLRGSPVPYRNVPDEEFRARSLAEGFPAPLVDLLLAYYEELRGEWASVPSPDLARLLGRPATGSLEAVRSALG